MDGAPPACGGDAAEDPEPPAGPEFCGSGGLSSAHMVKAALTSEEPDGKTSLDHGVSVCRSNFDTCCSAVEQLGGVAAQMSGIEKLFSLSTSVGGPGCQPAVTQSLQFVRAQTEACSADFTAWRTQLLCLGPQPSGDCRNNNSRRQITRYL